MKAPVDSIVAPSSLLSRAAAVKAFGLHYQTLLNWERSGKITAVRTVGNHRRFCPVSIRKALNLPIDAEGNDRFFCIYIRCSSSEQSKAGNLKRQRQRMIAEVCSREGCEEKDIKVFSDVASSYGDRDGLNALVEFIIEGKCSKVVAEHRDRISRVPSLTRLLESICRNRNIQLVFIETEETDDFVKQATEELIEFVTILSSRLCGRRGGASVKRVMSTVQLEKAYRYKKAGMSLVGVCSQFEKDGEADQRGKVFKGEGGRNIISRELKKHWRTLELTIGKGMECKNSFSAFCEKWITKCSDDKNGASQRIERITIVEAYQKWCADNNELEVSPSCISKTATRLGWEKHTKGPSSRKTSYVGITLNTRRRNRPLGT